MQLLFEQLAREHARLRPLPTKEEFAISTRYGLPGVFEEFPSAYAPLLLPDKNTYQQTVNRLHLFFTKFGGLGILGLVKKTVWCRF